MAPQASNPVLFSTPAKPMSTPCEKSGGRRNRYGEGEKTLRELQSRPYILDWKNERMEGYTKR